MSSARMELCLRLESAAPAADGIHVFEFRDPSGGDLPAFTAGAHIALRLAGGATRKYSLCNDPAERHRYVIAVKRERAGHGGSARLDDRAVAGAVFAAS